MKTFNEIEALWKQQKEVVVPDSTIIIEKANKDRKTMTKKIMLQVILLLVTVPVILWVLLANPFKETTTFLGIAIVLFDIIGFSVLRLYQVNKLAKIDFTATPKIVLSQLEKYYNFNKLLSSKIMIGYFLLLNIGLGLYFVEVMSPLPTYVIILSLTIYVAWIVFAYFVIGKKQKKKEFERIDNLITKMQTIEKEF